MMSTFPPAASWCFPNPHPPTHRVYMIHYSNAHTPRISLADGKHTAFISKSTIYFIIVSQSAVKFRNALDMRSLQSILCLFTWRLPKESKIRQRSSKQSPTPLQLTNCKEKVTFQSCFHPFLQCSNITVVHFLDFHTRHCQLEQSKVLTRGYILQVQTSAGKLCQLCVRFTLSNPSSHAERSKGDDGAPTWEVSRPLLVGVGEVGGRAPDGRLPQAWGASPPLDGLRLQQGGGLWKQGYVNPAGGRGLWNIKWCQQSDFVQLISWSIPETLLEMMLFLSFPPITLALPPPPPPPPPASHPGEKVPQLSKPPDHPPTPRHTGQASNNQWWKQGCAIVSCAFPGRGTEQVRPLWWVGSMCPPQPWKCVSPVYAAADAYKDIQDLVWSGCVVASSTVAGSGCGATEGRWALTYCANLAAYLRTLGPDPRSRT